MTQADTTALTIVLFLGLAVALPLIMVAIARWVAPSNPGAAKCAPYECGEIAVGRPWIRLRAAYYIFALVFVIFDIEVVFLIPWAVVYRRLGGIGLIEMGVFVGILTVGLVYAWRKGLLEWV
jgi:NADH-quinone oxidoreductase subunit A